MRVSGNKGARVIRRPPQPQPTSTPLRKREKLDSGCAMGRLVEKLGSQEHGQKMDWHVRAVCKIFSEIGMLNIYNNMLCIIPVGVSHERTAMSLCADPFPFRTLPYKQAR